ncbi:MAG: putative RNA-binding protein (virulence factor B family) [Halieaceae bacterium]|jgi:predicted RNA-binding protein (virulence factor B family)
MDKVFQRLSFSQSINGYIKNLRSDGEIDLTLKGARLLTQDIDDVVT